VASDTKETVIKPILHTFKYIILNDGEGYGGGTPYSEGEDIFRKDEINDVLFEEIEPNSNVSCYATEAYRDTGGGIA
jgi:hypothetical protein